MQIIGLTVTAPDVDATQQAWRRLGQAGVAVEVASGEPGLAAVTLGVDDVSATERLGNRVVLTTDDVEATLLALLAGGRRLPDLDVRGASLEEAVLSLTSRSRAPIGAGR